MSKNELLSDEEMSALLPPNADSGDGARDRRRIVPYNFRRPDRLSKEQVRSLYLLHDTFAHNLSLSLPLFLRTGAEINLISVEQLPYSDYLRGLTDPTNMFSIAAEQLRGVFAIEINSSIAFPVIDRMLGGDGEVLNEPRAATEIELKVLEGFISMVVDDYRETWKPTVEFDTAIIGRETRPQLLQIVAPNEIVSVVVYQIQIGESKGSLSVCLPVTMLESVVEKFNAASYLQTNQTAPEATGALLKTLAAVRLPVSAELFKVRAHVEDLMNLTTGDVLRTNHRVEKSVNVGIGSSIKFAGRLAALDGRMVVQVTENLHPLPAKKTSKQDTNQEVNQTIMHETALPISQEMSLQLAN